MGMGFRLNLKWDFPISCPTLTNSPSRLCTSSGVLINSLYFNFHMLFLFFNVFLCDVEQTQKGPEMIEFMSSFQLACDTQMGLNMI